MLWCCLGLAGVFFTDSWFVRSLLIVVAIGVTVHLVTLKTMGRRTSEDALECGGVRKEIWQTRES
jgi:hypothetical protein